MVKNEKWFIVVNPAANNSVCSLEWVQIKEVLDAEQWEYDYRETSYIRHAIELTQEAIKKGYRKFLAVGGTGTCNEVANGILSQTTVPSQDIILTTIPQGGISPWSSNYNIPYNYKKWIPQIDEKNYFIQDVIRIQYHLDGKELEHYGIGISSMMFGAKTAQMSLGEDIVEFNKFKFKYFIFKIFLSYKNRKATFRYNGKTLSNNFAHANVGVCRYTSGKKTFILPQAVPDSGLLAINHDTGSTTKIDRWRMLGHLLLNKFTKDKKIHIDTAPTFELIPEEDNIEYEVEVDGEFLGYAPVKYSILPKALKIIVPKATLDKKPWLN